MANDGSKGMDLRRSLRGSSTVGNVAAKNTPLRSCLASKLRNIDGKVVGKDGKPMKKGRCVQFDQPIGTSDNQSTNETNVNYDAHCDVHDDHITKPFGEAPSDINNDIGHVDPIGAFSQEGGANTNTIKSPIVSGSGTCERGKCEKTSHMDEYVTPSVEATGNATDAGIVKPPSFALIFKKPIAPKAVNLKEMKCNETVSEANVAIPLATVEEVSNGFNNTLYGYFIGKRLAFPIVENYVKNAWAKFGLERLMLTNGFFFFQFATREGMERVLKNGPWLIRLVPIILNIWTPNSGLKKDTITAASIWVKLHHVPIVAFSETGLSLITSQLGRLIML
ncbi:zinc knuckle CX2CX4HX4C containing protein, partial [Tanacetum coccineum]